MSYDKGINGEESGFHRYLIHNIVTLSSFPPVSQIGSLHTGLV